MNGRKGGDMKRSGPTPMCDSEHHEGYLGHSSR